MRKIITLVSAVALMMGLLTGVASASDDSILEQLEQDIEDAQSIVDELATVVAGLEAELVVAERELREAEDAYDAQQLVVDGLRVEYDLAETALNTAIAHRDDLQAQYDACNPARSGQNNGNQCRGQLNGPIENADDEIEAKQAAYDEALGELNEAAADLEKLDGIVGEKQDAVDDLVEEIANAKADLEEAKDDLDAAIRARDEYLASLENNRHEGCNGIEKAVAQVTTKGNGKGKAAEVLTKKAADWNCAA